MAADGTASGINLTLCVIVKDEVSTLADCLGPVRQVCGQLVVVDTGSTDGRQDLARRLGADVLEMSWGNDFSEARNRSLEAAKGRWVMVRDADESML